MVTWEELGFGEEDEKHDSLKEGAYLRSENKPWALKILETGELHIEEITE